MCVYISIYTPVKALLQFHTLKHTVTDHTELKKKKNSHNPNWHSHKN